MRHFFFLFFSFILALSLSFAATTNNSVKVVIFYGEGCPHCHNMLQFLADLNKILPFELVKYEVYYSHENALLFEDFASRYGIKVEGVPTIFIGDSVFVGDAQSTKEKVREKIKQCSISGCADPFTFGKKEKKEENSAPKSVPLLILIGAAIVDSINPCTIAVLVILLTTLLTVMSRKYVLFSGFAFSLAIFLSYFAMGVGLYSFFATTSHFKTVFYYFLFLLATIMGLINIRAYFQYRPGFVSLEMPMFLRKIVRGCMQKIKTTKFVTLTSFLLGFLCSVTLIPCSSGPYIIVLGMLSHEAQKWLAYSLLVLYNLIFIAPMLLITLIIYFGKTQAEKVGEWKEKHIRELHLASGIILLIIGILLLFIA